MDLKNFVRGPRCLFDRVFLFNFESIKLKFLKKYVTNTIKDRK